MRRFSVFLALMLASLVFLAGCPFMPGPEPVNVTNQTNVTPPTQNYTCPDGTIVKDPSQCEIDMCPSTCDDGNICTIDSCNRETGYECVHKAKVPCCGDGACSDGETMESCIIDCGSCPPECDDFNPCTRDRCSSSTGFLCTHEKLSGETVGCSGYPGFEGYSNVDRQFGFEPPLGWEISTEISEGGEVLFEGPSYLSNCSEKATYDNGTYVDLEYGFSMLPLRGWSVSKDRDAVFVFGNGTQSEVLVTWWVSPELTAQRLGIYGGKDAVIYIRAEKLPADGFDSMMLRIRQEMLLAKNSGSEISEMGIAFSNITSFVERKDKSGEFYWREFSIFGTSNRSSDGQLEWHKRIYLPYGGTLYEIALVSREESYPEAERGFLSMFSTFNLFARSTCGNDLYASKIRVYSGPANPAYLLNDYLREATARVSEMPGYSLIETGDQTLDGNPAKFAVMSFLEDGFPVKRKSVVSYRKGLAYEIDYTATRAGFERGLQSFDSSTSTFRILPVAGNCKHQSCADGVCIVAPVKRCCGNGFCEEGESCSSCKDDCGVCSSSYPPLHADLTYLEGEPHYYSTFNCENYLVRVNIENELDEPLTVFSRDALQLKSGADSTCRAEAKSKIYCIATMSGAFGDAYYNDTVERTLTLFGYGGTNIGEGELIYAKTFRFNVTYKISWIGPFCMHFYCTPGTIKRYYGIDYNITGIREYRGDILVGNWWCNANHTYDSGIYGEIYFNQFYNKTCLVSWSRTGVKTGESCENMN
ncbi:MAG: hypothetical protein ABIF01_00600 [Candidatus Micrarchaeota archaeon]